MRRARGGAIVLAVLAGAPACEERSTLAPEAGSYVTARVRGAVSVDYLGTGWFHLGAVPQRIGTPVVFTLMSESADGAPRRLLQLFGELPSVPGPGAHPIGLGGGELRAAFYTRTAEGGEALEAFAASEGELSIHAADDDWLRGELRFRAFRYCERTSLAAGECLLPDEPLASSAWIEVTGSFVAERLRGTPAAAAVFHPWAGAEQ